MRVASGLQKVHSVPFAVVLVQAGDFVPARVPQQGEKRRWPLGLSGHLAAVNPAVSRANLNRVGGSMCKKPDCQLPPNSTKPALTAQGAEPPNLRGVPFACENFEEIHGAINFSHQLRAPP